MKKLAGVFLVLFGVAILVVAIGFFLYGRSFTLTHTSHDEFTVELPLQTVAINLMLSNVSDKIAERLGMTILKKERVEQSGEISMPAFLSGTWNIRMVEESECEMDDSNLGKIRLKIRTITEATPKNVTTTTVLVEPVGSLQDIEQVIVITPVEEPAAEEPAPEKKGGLLGLVFRKAEGRTTIAVNYTTTVEINYPGLPFIREEAERRLEESHAHTVSVLVDTLKDTAEHPSLDMRDGESSAPKPTMEMPEPAVVPAVSDTESPKESETDAEEAPVSFDDF